MKSKEIDRIIEQAEYGKTISWNQGHKEEEQIFEAIILALKDFKQKEKNERRNKKT